MKKKNNIILCAILLCAAIFATTAFADAAMGSAYNSLKDGAKTTAAAVTNENSSFSASATVSIVVDGAIYVEGTESGKYDLINKKFEMQNSTSGYGSDFDSSYEYRDTEKEIYTIPGSNEYSVSYYSDNHRIEHYYDNPFNEEIAPKVENVFDALVGNLKDLVQAEEIDGKTVYTAELNETQVPSLANAITSLIVDQTLTENNKGINNEVANLPKLKNNIYVQSASAKAIQNADGIFESGVGQITLVGDDLNGATHTIELQLSGDITDINSTVVEEPIIPEDAVVNTNNIEPDNVMSEKYIGKYVMNIVDEQDNRLVKTGENIFEITSVEGDAFYGTFTVTGDEIAVYGFTGKKSDRYDMQIEYTDADGQTRYAVLYTTGSKAENLSVQFGVSADDKGYDSDDISKDEKAWSGEYTRVFE